MDLTSFMTLENLKTLAGQVMAVGLLLQVFKQFLPKAWDTDKVKQSLSVLVGVGLNGYLTAWGHGPQAWLLAVINGSIVAAAAMKGYEAMAPMWKKSNGTSAAGTAVKAGIVLLIGASTLVGCAYFGYQKSTLAVPRDEFLIVYGEGRALAKLGIVVGKQSCDAGTIAPPLCQLGNELKSRAVTLDGIVMAAVQDKGTLKPQEVSELMTTGLRLVTMVVPQAGAASGILGAIGNLGSLIR